MPGQGPDNLEEFLGVPDHLAELIVRYYDADLSEQEADELRAGLSQSASARDWFVRLGLQSQSLAEALAPQYSEADDELPPIHIDANTLTKQKYVSALTYVIEHTFTPKRLVVFASAAALLLGVVLAIVLLGGPGNQEAVVEDYTYVPPEVKQAAVEATLRSSSLAVWSDPVSVKDGLKTGVQVELLSGIAEIEFDQGAVVLVHGPSVITPTGANKLRLDRGMLVAEVPPAAIGFEVDTRFGLIQDFGTEFGLKVDPYQGLETRVFEGEIGVMARDDNTELGTMTRLAKNDVAKIVAGTAQVVTDEPVASDYVRRDAYTLLTKPNPTPAERWEAHLLQLVISRKMIAHLGFSGGAMQLMRGPAGESFEAHWVDGKIIPIPGSQDGFQAMRLEGAPEQGIDLKMPGHPGYEKLTFIAWARVEPHVNRTNAPLLHHSRKDMPKSIPNWQLRPDLDAIHVNQFAEEGSTISSRRVAASLDGIEWQQWHCYAVVLDARSGQCDHYLDGRWVGSGELAQKVPLRLDGLRISSTGRAVTDHPRTIKGEIGTFTFLNTTLGADEIRQMYNASRPLFD